MEEPMQEPPTADDVKVEPTLGPKSEPEQTSSKEEAAAAVDKSVVMANLREILPTVDLDVTTEKMLRKRLEEAFKTDFTHLKSDIRKEIESWMDAQQPEEEEEEEQVEAPKKKARGGFGKLAKLSPALAEFLGVESENRAQVVKKIWDYIKLHDLQDPKDRRKIKPDAKLSKVFPKTVTMFTMNKVLNKHFITDDGEPALPKSRKKKRDEEDDEDDEEEDDDDDDDGDYKAAKPKKAAKTSKSGGGGGSVFTRAMKLSPGLAALVGAAEMSRPDLTKFFTGYFKENNLLKPTDKRVVICDDKLKALFQVDEFIAFGHIQRLLSPHLSKL